MFRANPFELKQELLPAIPVTTPDSVNGSDRKAFRFTTIGQLASIGHHTGVAQILGMRFSGFIAWWLWRSVYLAKLPGFAKKVRVATQWTLDLLFSRQIEQFLTLKDLEQIEQLSALVRRSQSEVHSPEANPRPSAYTEPNHSKREASTCGTSNPQPVC